MAKKAKGTKKRASAVKLPRVGLPAFEASPAPSNIGSQPMRLHPILAQHTGYCLYKAAMKLRSMTDEELKPFGVIAPQMGILSILNETGPINQISLVAQMSIDKATMVKLIDGLERLGYVERVAGERDRREKIVSITGLGHKKRKEMYARARRVESEFLQELSTEQRDRLRESLRLILKVDRI